jgi:hypothetical protein
MRKFVRLLILIGIMAPLSLYAQDPTLKVSSKKQVAVGEQFQVSFELNAEGRNFVAPNFDNFSIVGGPFTSSSSSMQIINGSTTHSVKNTYSFVLRAIKEGSFIIKEAAITVKGKKVMSEPFEIKVVAGKAANNAGSGNGGEGANNTNDSKVTGQDLFLKVIPNKKSAFIGEQIVLTYRIYTRVPVSSLSVSKMPTYGGFWMKDITNNSSGTLQQSTEYVNNVEYSVADVQKIVIIPQKVGHLSIEPMGIECVAQIQTESHRRQSNDPFEAFFNDPFFSRNFANVKKDIQSQTLSIDVKNLPSSNKPSSFTGAVGQFSFDARIDKTSLKTNEAFTLTLIVRGTGNVELLEMPRPFFPPDFEVYEPKISTSTDATAQGIAGTKKAEYLIIPRNPGDFSIPPIEFSFFNPSKGEYIQLKSEQYDIKVEKGSGSSAEGSVYSTNQEGIKYLGSDIRHIMTDNARLKPIHATFFASFGYFLVLVMLFAFFVAAFIFYKQQAKYKRNISLVRNKQATKVARGRLKNALKYLKEKNQSDFYVEMSQALWGYISDKLSIERSVLSIDTVKGAMTEKNVPEDLITQFIDTLNSCEFARFAPGDAGQRMEDLYQKGIEVITKAEKVLK